MNNLFKPLNCDFSMFDKPRHLRVVMFDPTELANRIPEYLKEHRYNSVSTEILFPLANNLCACGCGKTLQKRQKRYASADCSYFCSSVWAIISGQVITIRWFIEKLFGSKCAHCGDSETKLYLDHIIAVKNGGSRAWLSNYQLLCKNCHTIKTNKDMGWKTKKPIPAKNQIKMF